MDFKKVSFILFPGLTIYILLLLSYHLILLTTPLTQNQELVFAYLAQKSPPPVEITPSEVSHLDDVRSVMILVDTLLYFSILACTLILTYYRSDQELVQKWWQYGGMAAIAFLVLLLLGIVLFFNTSFTLFHLLFFPQGNWQFAADSFLIQTFPGEFFASFAWKMGMTALFLGILCCVVSKFISSRRAITKSN